ncbi:MAG: hypothetical protein HOC09_25825 [Deltaproteobacteria bacterium]|nr:hypothetical protein [Deltaproteobacteria bacterium]
MNLNLQFPELNLAGTSLSVTGCGLSFQHCIYEPGGAGKVGVDPDRGQRLQFGEYV